MQQHTVVAGDTLMGLARSKLGDASKWQLIAQANGLTGTSLSVGQVLVIPDGSGGATATEPQEAVADPATANETAPAGSDVAPGPADPGDGRIYREGDHWYADTGEGKPHRIGKQHKLGLYRPGSLAPDAFIAEAGDLLQGIRMSPSEIRVIASIADNEGKLDAVNTWDGHFLSFGFFQWTSGGAGDPGELPALLGRLQADFPAAFQAWFGVHGLGVQPSNATTGWLTLNGVRLDSAERKAQLRQPLWAWRFARSAAGREVCASQIAHAASRIDRFYVKPQDALGGHPLSDLVQSERGVALLLDNHVNRPAWVVDCVAEGLKRIGKSADQLAAGGDADERALLDAYLDVREGYSRGSTAPMTHSRERAASIERRVASGALSPTRGSFVRA